MSTKMIKSMMSNTLTLALALVIFMMSFAPSIAYAAADHSPYGFTYDDSASGKTEYIYYNYSTKEDSFIQSREFYSKATSVYTFDGVFVSNTLASGSLCNGFGLLGAFYIITPETAVKIVTLNNEVYTIVESGAIKFLYNSNDLAISVVTTSGTYDLSTLKKISDTDDGTSLNPIKKSANRVEMYTNSAGELTYDAYKNGILKTQLVVSKNGKKVLNVTSDVILTDYLKGAKFVGFDRSYNVYLYETDTLYRFINGQWYSAEKISLSGTYKTFRPDDDGFIESIIIKESDGTEKTLGIKQLTASGKWRAKKTYAVEKSNYVTLYVKGSSKSNTLMKTSGNLQFNGNVIALKISKYGFTKSKKIFYVKNGTAYTASLSDPYNAKKLCSNVKSVKKNKLGLICKVILKNGKSKTVR